jgi:putative ATP-binding cassette transporter
MRHGAISTLRRSSVFHRFARTAAGFWNGQFTSMSWTMGAFLIVVVLCALLTQIRLNIWNRDFFNALERKDAAAIMQQVVVFVPLALASIALAILGVWGRMTVQRRWREWLSRHLISLWLANGRYRRLASLVDDHKNPEYRIAEDARVATDAPVDFGVGLLTSCLTAVTFIGILWNVGGDLDTDLFNHRVSLPGYLVIAAIAYAILTTIGMLFVGRNLVTAFEGKNQAEAELRQAATRVRENALRDDLVANHAALHASLEQVIAHWRRLCGQLMQTTLITHGNTLMAPVVALALCAPKYLNGTMMLGDVTQAAAAFVIVQAAFNWLVDNYPRVADWISSANRVGALLELLDEADRQMPMEPAFLDPTSPPVGRV